MNPDEQQRSPKSPRLSYEAPRDRLGYWLRAVIALVFAFTMLAVASACVVGGSNAAAVLALAGSSFFSVSALASVRRASAEGSPLTLDEHGMHVDDGLGITWSATWAQIRDVTLERNSWGGAHVVLELHDPQPMNERLRVPRSCLGDMPPEWLAGLIDTFRMRARARALGSAPNSDVSASSAADPID